MPEQGWEGQQWRGWTMCHVGRPGPRRGARAVRSISVPLGGKGDYETKLLGVFKGHVSSICCSHGGKDQSHSLGEEVGASPA